jgi:hypothetical protein
MMTIKRKVNEVRVVQSLVFSVEFDVCSFRLGIALSVLRFAASGNPFDIINLFLFQVFIQILCRIQIPLRYGNALAKRENGRTQYSTVPFTQSSVPFRQK